MIETLYQYTILDIEVTTLDSRLLSLEMTWLTNKLQTCFLFNINHIKTCSSGRSEETSL